MILRALRLLKVLDTLGPLKGRKKLHKLVYVLQSTGDQLGYEFDLHYYGPYSYSLAEDLQALRTTNLLSETLDGQTYTLTLTSKGKQLCERLAQGFTFNRGLAESLVGASPAALEVAATAVYLASLRSAETRVFEVLHSLKPNLKPYYGAASELLTRVAAALPASVSVTISELAKKLPSESPQPSR